MYLNGKMISIVSHSFDTMFHEGGRGDEGEYWWG
jgi:hypothetical protein